MLACTSAAKALPGDTITITGTATLGRIPTAAMMRDAAMKVPLALKDKSDLSYRVVDFGSAIERMICACDQQVVELKKCRSMPLLKSSSPLRINVKL
jgi:hypothetical protein